MRRQNRIQSFLAFGLVLLFSVQAGLGLLLHTRLHIHTSAVAESYSAKNQATVSEVTINCSCLDYFSTPFITADFAIAPAPVSIYYQLEKPVYPNPVFQAIQSFRPLRAPPVFLS